MLVARSAEALAELSAALPGPSAAVAGDVADTEVVGRGRRRRGGSAACGASSTTPASTPSTTRSPRPRCRSGTRSCGSTCWAPPPSPARSGGSWPRPAAGGRIINLSSVAGLTGLPNIGPYNASKAAIDALTRTLAVELGPAGVLCNSVAPGTIATEMVEGLMTANPVLKERLVSKSPLARIGTVPEAAWPIIFLLTDAASFITGQTLVVDGGRLAAG